MQDLPICDHLISFSIMSFRFIHSVLNGRIFFFLRLNNVPLCAHTTFSLSIHLLIDTACYYILAIMNNTVINMEVQVSL